MNKIQKFKQELARVFDDNLHTKQWQYPLDNNWLSMSRNPIYPTS